jgi:glycosyltransferase involved in cell wall biosynthesis
VLIIVQNLPVPLDRRVWMECRSLRRAGFDVSVICPMGPDRVAFEELEGVRIHRYRPAPEAQGLAGYVVEFAYAWLRTLWLSLAVWRGRRFDAIQACNPPDTYWALALLYRPFGVRFVYDQHDLCPEVYESRFGDEGSGVQLGTMRAFEQAAYRTAHHVITVNESYRAIALGRGKRKPTGVTVVRSGPDPDRMRRGEPKPDLRHGRPDLACYLGVMGPQDGVDLLLQAIDVYVHELGRDDCHFALLGFGDCLRDLQAMAADLSLDEWVTFTGRADDAMITDYLSTATFGLDPDPLNPLNDVSTMNKVLEYMAFELPVVTFDLKETRVSAGEAARYVEPNDVGLFAKAMADLLDSPADERRCMGEIGRARIEDELGWHHQAARYVGVYENLLGAPPRPVESRSATPLATPNARVKVLHLLPDLQIGGGQTIVLNGLRYADLDHVDPIVCYLDPADDMVPPFTDAGYPPRRIAHEPGRGLLTVAKLVRLIRDERVDVIHVHSDLDRTYGQLAALVTGIPVVSHLHAVWVHFGPNLPADPSSVQKARAHALAQVRNRVERRTVGHYLAESEDVKTVFTPLVDLPITVVQQSVDVDAFDRAVATGARERVRAELGIGDRPLLINVSRLVEGKGQHFLVEALARLNDSHPDAVLVLVGDGDKRAFVEKLAADAGLSDRVMFLGNRFDIPDLLAAADLFVFASESEGFGMVALEAMGAGLPVIAFRLPALQEFVADGVSGHLVELNDPGALADAVDSLLDDPEERAVMGAAGRRVVDERFHPRSTAASFEAAYDAAIARSIR